MQARFQISRAIVLTIAAIALSFHWTAAQELIDPTSGGANAASEEPSRRRSILRRDRAAESEPAAAAATEAPPYRPESGATTAGGAQAAGSATGTVAPATAATPQNGSQRYPEQPATYSAAPGRPYLGVTFDMRYPNAAVVKAVAPGGPAAQSGIRPGDAIHAINRRFISTWQEVVATVQSLRPGDQLDISYSRRVEERTQVVLTGRDAEGAQSASYDEPPAAPAAGAARAPTPGPEAERATPETPPAAAGPAPNSQTPAAGEDAQEGRLGRDRSAQPRRQRGGLFRRN
jgi:hypothetical protein